MTPLVLVPGLLCTAELFAPQVAALWPYGSITVASTLEGETMAEIAAAILATAPPRFALAGLSMGGYICFEIMRQAPERVSKLALLDTSARPDAPQQVAQRHALLEQARQGDFAAVAARGLTAVLHPAHQQDAALRAIHERMGQAVGLAGLARELAAVIGRPDSRPDLAAITVPTLVVVGADDAVTPPDQAEELAAAIAGARLVVVPECGHSTTLEQPAAVNQALVDWLRA
ncbi:alpha/beta fold hydrolase [Hymenobacter sp. HMF4947]|uniref:Alpha/beta fold hydrolase n=1 Tax=Hymenobacter ginkgonis TaxID=2682976 RepID=A0A7K1TGQ6_9BACT|nr:alpha/beta fold hydrolase [Hymenobacter ginkgonis]MVN77590.1 alpha/beta fold hydrolase [Hymenobacter ginkgonis]